MTAPKPTKPPTAIERRMYALAFEAIKEKLHEMLAGQPLVVIGWVVASLHAIIVAAVPWPAPVTKAMDGIVNAAVALELWKP